MIISPIGGVTVRVGTTPQGQGHRTVCAQVTADALGLRPEEVDVVTELDTSTSPWTVASGNYSSRFSGVGTGAVHLAALKVAAKLRTIAAAELDCDPATSSCATARRGAMTVRHSAPACRHRALAPGIAAGRGRAGTARDGVLRPPNLAAPDADDRVASSAAHGFVVDVAVVEVDGETGPSRCSTTRRSTTRAGS